MFAHTHKSWLLANEQPMANDEHSKEVLRLIAALTERVYRLEQLAALSVLARWIDEAEIETCPPVSPQPS